MAIGLQYDASNFDPATDELIFGGGGTSAIPFSVDETIKESAQNAKVKADAVAEFSSWLEKNFPDVFKAVMQSRPDLLVPEFALAGLAGLSAEDAASTPSPLSDWAKALSEILAPISGAYAQKQCIDVNIKRAEMGLPPIDCANMTAPTVNVGVTPEVKQMGMIAALAFAGVLFLMLRKR